MAKKVQNHAGTKAVNVRVALFLILAVRVHIPVHGLGVDPGNGAPTLMLQVIVNLYRNGAISEEV